MSLKLLLEGAEEIDPGVWSVRVAPHEVQLLGPPKATSGGRSVVLVEGGIFDAAAASLQLDASRVSVLNLGTTADVLVIASEPLGQNSAEPTARDGTSKSSEHPGRGDREFLQLVDRCLSGPAKQAAESILHQVRSRYPGDLQRGQRMNFKNTPDNFWYVIVQPRAQSLSITVRGAADRFSSPIFDLKPDRPGYTRFTLRDPSEVEDALRIIEASKRR